MNQYLFNQTTRAAAALVILLVGAAANAGVIPRDVSLAPLVRDVSPAVVNISTRGTVEVSRPPMLDDPMFRRFFPDQPAERQTGSLGSGVIVDAADGHILTNHHVVENADEITVQLVDGREFEAELVGSDADSDLAVVKIDPDNLTALKIGDSERLEVGDYVLALGNPFGLGHTVTSGIVSATGRNGLNPANYEDFIQTDAAINRGNSGGALINLQGELVGINTAIIGPGGGNVGIGFAIPSGMAATVMEQLLEFGKVSRGLLGIQGEPVTAVIADYYDLDTVRGAVVTEVSEGSGAEEAGLKIDDVIIAVDGQSIDNFNDLRNVIGLRRPGEGVELQVVRDGKTRTFNATLGARQPAQIAQAEPEREDVLGGVRLSEIPDDHPLSGEVDGVMVEAVARGSEAQSKGLQPGDIIVAINRADVESLADANQILSGEAKDRYLLKVKRGQITRFVVLS
ncbi:MAG: Do family serine endopeptidase [Pseudomonadota bacterium]